MGEATERAGGAFLVGTGRDEPWRASGDHPETQLLGEASRNFMRSAVLPHNASLERGDHPRLRSLIEEAGRAGLLSIEIPPEFGGLGAPPASSQAVLSGLGHHSGFAVTCAANLTIGTVPVLRYGSAELRRALLPEIASGRRVGAYALTEPGSGSDALSMSTRAEPASGGFQITGAKCFITNAGFADHLLVFARVDGRGPTAFLVDARADGVSVGAEEPKMGLHTASTRQVFFDGAYVPAERVIGDPGQGHRVALDALVVGRHKLGVLASGHLELLLEVGAQYAAERKQAGRPIGELGMVARLLGESVARAWALDAVVSRAAPLVTPEAEDLSSAMVEAAACKVTGSESLCAVADAMLQLHGGLGYIRGTWVEQSYRDVRANRIYEGTDEVNRRAIAGGVLRSIRRGRFDLHTQAQEARWALADSPRSPDVWGLASHVRRLALVGVSAATELPDGRDELEGAVADLVIAAWVADSAARRAEGADTHRALHEAAALLVIADSVERAHRAYGALAAAARTRLPTRALSLLDVAPGLDRAELYRLLARAALAEGRDPFTRYDPIRPPPCGS